MVRTYETPRRIVVGETTVDVVERTRVSAHRVGNRLWFVARKDFGDIVVRGPAGTRRFSLETPSTGD